MSKVKRVLLITDALENHGSNLRKKWMRANKKLNIPYKTGKLIRRLRQISKPYMEDKK